MKIIKHFTTYSLLIYILFLFSPASLQAQAVSSEGGAVIEEIKEASPIREELQRYIGYEDLLQRYLSLPYDVTMNTNVKGTYIDISFLLFMLLPIIFLLGNNLKPWLGLLAVGLLLIILTISVPIAYSSNNNIDVTEMGTHLQQFFASTSFSDSPITWLASCFYVVFNTLYAPIHPLLQSISGQTDYITYPLLMGLFIGVFFMLDQRLKAQSLLNKSLVYFLYFFSFLWFLLSAGIAWYGMLMLPLGIMFALIGWTKNDLLFLKNQKFNHALLIGIVGIWMLMSYTYRMSSYNPTTSNTAKQALYPVVVQYAGGKINDKKLMGAVFPNFDKALLAINSETESLVYKVGTFMGYFIDKNNKRVLSDNQLGVFQGLVQKYQNKYELAQVFKASGYRYIVIDLKTADIDKTPEQSLTKKFQLFMNFLYQNPALELVSTDRIIVDENGKQSFNVFGTTAKYGGTFAVYQIK